MLQGAAGDLCGTGHTCLPLHHPVFSLPLAVESHQGASLLRRVFQSQNSSSHAPLCRAAMMDTGWSCRATGTSVRGALLGAPHRSPEREMLGQAAWASARGQEVSQGSPPLTESRTVSGEEGRRGVRLLSSLSKHTVCLDPCTKEQGWVPTMATTRERARDPTGLWYSSGVWKD